jgi:hypothetical protein
MSEDGVDVEWMLYAVKHKMRETITSMRMQKTTSVQCLSHQTKKDVGVPSAKSESPIALPRCEIAPTQPEDSLDDFNVISSWAARPRSKDVVQQFDLVMAVSRVALDKMIHGRAVRDCDVVIGVHSSGIPNNGLSLPRKAFFADHRYGIDHKFDELSVTLGEELLRPDRHLRARGAGDSARRRRRACAEQHHRRWLAQSRPRRRAGRL